MILRNVNCEEAGSQDLKNLFGLVEHGEEKGERGREKSGRGKEKGEEREGE